MTSEDKPHQPTEEGQPPQQEPTDQPPIEEEEETPFIDKVIAFAILSIPFSALLAWLRDVLTEQFSIRVAHIVLLIGIVTFLLSLGNAARWIHRFRTRKQG